MGCGGRARGSTKATITARGHQSQYNRHRVWPNTSVPNHPEASRGPVERLARDPDGTGPLSVVRLGRPKCRTAVFGHDGGPYRVRHVSSGQGGGWPVTVEDGRGLWVTADSRLLKVTKSLALRSNMIATPHNNSPPQCRGIKQPESDTKRPLNERVRIIELCSFGMSFPQIEAEISQAPWYRKDGLAFLLT